MRWYTRRLEPERIDGPGWGPSTEYIEVDADGWATRQVELFDNGQSLKYDRAHWIDYHGELFGLPLPDGRVAGSWCSADEFSRAWTSVPDPNAWDRALSGIGPRPLHPAGPHRDALNAAGEPGIGELEEVALHWIARDPILE